MECNKDQRHLGRHAKPAKIMMGPRNMETTLQQRRSTKQLISRYESMSVAGALRSVSSSSSCRGPAAKSFRSIGISKGLPPLAVGRKDKSILRQSFSNLLSVFKIGKGSIEDSSSIVSSSSPDEHLTSNNVGGVSSVSENQIYLYSGTLLYLSRPSTSPWASPILPVWTTCTANLVAGEIRITWLTTQGNPSTHIISLASCSDVRSLPLDQVDPNERALLPTKGDAEDLKVFEILFEGQPREKFAVTSVQGRAGWVSAIWWVETT